MDQVTSTQAKFCLGSKQCPVSLSFHFDLAFEDAGMRNHFNFIVAEACEDAGMRNHFYFIVAALNLRASIYDIKGWTDEEYFRKILQDVIVPNFNPVEGVKIAANKEEAKQENSNTGGGLGNVNNEC